MSRVVPERLVDFFMNGIKDVDDSCEYSSQLNRLLSRTECRNSLNEREIELLRNYAEKVMKIGELDCYSIEKIQDIEQEIFGTRGVLGFLGVSAQHCLVKPTWPF